MGLLRLGLSGTRTWCSPQAVEIQGTREQGRVVTDGRLICDDESDSLSPAVPSAGLVTESMSCAEFS